MPLLFFLFLFIFTTIRQLKEFIEGIFISAACKELQKSSFFTFHRSYNHILIYNSSFHFTLLFFATFLFSFTNFSFIFSLICTAIIKSSLISTKEFLFSHLNSSQLLLAKKYIFLCSLVNSLCQFPLHLMC